MKQRHVLTIMAFGGSSKYNHFVFSMSILDIENKGEKTDLPTATPNNDIQNIYIDDDRQNNQYCISTHCI